LALLEARNIANAAMAVDISSPTLDYDASAIRAVVAKRDWMQLPTKERIGAICDFVRDHIGFGYNDADDLPALQMSTEISASSMIRTVSTLSMGPICFYAQHGANLRGIRRLVYRHVIRHLMNARVQTIRASGGQPACTLSS
jgi:hypothetical protein